MWFRPAGLHIRRSAGAASALPPPPARFRRHSTHHALRESVEGRVRPVDVGEHVAVGDPVRPRQLLQGVEDVAEVGGATQWKRTKLKPYYLKLPLVHIIGKTFSFL